MVAMIISAVCMSFPLPLHHKKRDVLLASLPTSCPRSFHSSSSPSSALSRCRTWVDAPIRPMCPQSSPIRDNLLYYYL